MQKKNQRKTFDSSILPFFRLILALTLETCPRCVDIKDSIVYLPENIYFSMN